MTGADVQSRLDTIVQDLSKPGGRGKTINIMFRNPDNTPNILPLSSDVNGVVNSGQLAAVQSFVVGLITALDTYNTVYEPVQTANEDFKTARDTFATLISAETAARTALRTATAADPDYVAAKNALNSARTNPAYIAAAAVYRGNNISENIAELTQARNSYVD